MSVSPASVNTAKELFLVPESLEHPYLFVHRDDVPRLRAKAERCEWAARELQRIHEQADALMKEDLNCPPSTGRHSLNYLCPECKERLKTLSATQHQCRICEKIFSGDPYDGVLYKVQHAKLAKAVVTLGLASLFFDDTSYARQAAEILLNYADVYSTYPMVNPYGVLQKFGARVADQSLNESIWLISIAWGYDLVLGANVTTHQEREHIENDLLRPSAAVAGIRGRLTNNWVSWHNAGLIAVGLCLRDEKMIETAVAKPGGFIYQMKHSITPEGMQIEGSWSYHYYALDAFLQTAEMAWQSGIDLYQCEPLKKALLLPLKMTLPNGKTPAFNDGDESSPPVSFYEYAAARMGDPAFEDFLSRSQRKGLQAFLVGVEEPKSATRSLKSVILKESGYAVMRQGDNYTCIDFGPHGGNHGHADKLSLLHFTDGLTIVPDAGRYWPYNHPSHGGYFQRTLAHNTVMVDGMTQSPSVGEYVSHSFGKDYDWVTVRDTSAYEGVMMERTVAVSEDWLVDSFEVISATPRVFDWVWHVRGDESCSLDLVPGELTGESPGYDFIENVRTTNVDDDWKMSWDYLPKPLPGRSEIVSGTKEFRALFDLSEPEKIYLFETPNNRVRKTSAGLIRRRKGKNTRFLSLFSSRPLTFNDLPDSLRKELDLP